MSLLVLYNQQDYSDELYIIPTPQSGKSKMYVYRLYILSVIFMCDIIVGGGGKKKPVSKKRSHGLWKIKSKKVSAGDGEEVYIWWSV